MHRLILPPLLAPLMSVVVVAGTLVLRNGTRVVVYY
jgi:hypothetical protein